MDVRGFRWLIALALVSAACSGPTRGGAPDAVSTSTSLSTIPGTVHDTAPPSGDPAVAAPGSSPTTPGAALGGRGTTTTTTVRQQGSSSDIRPGSSPTSITPAATTAPPAGLPPEKCPDAKTCRRYSYVDGPRRWRAGPDGRVTIPYRINPSGSTTLTPEQIEGAMAAAFRTWEQAAPVLRFVYEGRTTVQATSFDGVNVVAFNGPTIEHTSPVGDRDGAHVVEFDMLYTPNGWTWAPCQQADGSCTPHSTTTPTGAYPRDLQSIATHAVGHVLWLGDQNDFDLDRELSMYPDLSRHPLGSRFWSTLALGDVLGVRSLYPCSCPLPRIYTP